MRHGWDSKILKQGVNSPIASQTAPFKERTGYIAGKKQDDD
jgi:hypothetical protein